MQVLVALVLVVGPLGLLKMQLKKRNLSGPWDIARL